MNAPVEAQSADADLDALLAEFDQKTAASEIPVAEPEPAQPEAAPYVDPLQEAEAAMRVASEMQQLQQRGQAAEQ